MTIFRTDKHYDKKKLVPNDFTQYILDIYELRRLEYLRYIHIAREWDRYRDQKERAVPFPVPVPFSCSMKKPLLIREFMSLKRE